MPGTRSSRCTDVPEEEIERNASSTSSGRRSQLRKVSDVPVGVFLSGGVDSSTNAALFSEGETSPVKTFSIGYDQDYASYPSELPWARRMAAEVGAEHHERILSLDDLLGSCPRWRGSRTSRSPIPCAFPSTTSPSSRGEKA